VFVSNIPQAIAPSADLAASGWGARRLGGLWFLVVLACGVAAALGFLGTDLTSDVVGDRAAAIAAGGLLAMLTNSLMPFSFERGGALAGAGDGPRLLPLGAEQLREPEPVSRDQQEIRLDLGQLRELSAVFAASRWLLDIG
jgi:hypothetical protein